MLIKQVKVKYRDASYTPEHAGILEATTDVKSIRRAVDEWIY